MAIVPKDSMLDGMRGRLGDLVFRVQGDRTIVSHRPRRPNKVPITMSRSRRENLTRFQQAVEFARDARSRPAFRSLSRLLGGFSPYHVALQDFLSKPVIERITFSGAGESRPSGWRTISIHASERIAIRSVRIRRVIRKASRGNNVSYPDSPKFSASAAVTNQESPDRQRQLPPAATFFKKTAPPAQMTRSEATNISADIPPDNLPAPRSTTPTETPPEMASEPAERVVRASRVSPLEKNRDLKDPTPRTEVWHARLFWDGEIEVVVSDYAGNRAVQLVHISDIKAGDST